MVVNRWTCARAFLACVATTVLACDQGESVEEPIWNPELPRDSIPPILSVDGPAAGTPGFAVPGETISISVSASDNTAIAWGGFRIGPPVNLQDSVEGRGRSFHHSFELEIDPAWVGLAEVTHFAYDCPDPVGRCNYEFIPNISEVTADTLDVRALTPRQFDAYPLPGWTYDWAYDAKRDLLYLSQRDSLRIGVFNLTTREYEAPIALFSEPHGIDLTDGSDSLIVALRFTPYIGILDLTVAPPTLDTLRLGFVEEYGRGARYVRVAANDKAIVTLTKEGSGGGQVWELDLTTGVPSRRIDVGLNGAVSQMAPLASSLDDGTILMIDDDRCCPTQATVYAAGADTFTPMMPVANRFFPNYALTRDGALVLVDHILFDRDLNPLVIADPADFEFDFYYGNAQTIAPNGSVLYFGTRYGYTTIRVSDGAVLERVGLPDNVSQWMFLPDENTLLIRTDVTPHLPLEPQLFVVDLR